MDDKNIKTISKKQKKINDNRDNRELAKTKMVEKIQTEYKDMLLPTLKEKTKEITEMIVKKLEKRGENVNSVEILSTIAKRSLVDVATGNANSYTPQEIMIAFNLYIEMIDKIQQYKNFPPTVETFCLFLGISRSTYNNWLADPSRKDAMDYIHSYLLGVLANGGLIGEVKEISAMYQQKVMGKVEATTPIVIEHKKETNIDEINAQLEALKGKKIIDAEWEEKDE